MGYSLHIERSSGDTVTPISIDEWKSAVASVGGVRLQTADKTISNPAKPEQSIRMPLKEGCVEVYIPAENLWAPVITWFEGRAKFRAQRVMDDTDPIWTAAARLAILLSANIRGDEGELYNLATGKPVNT